MKASARQAAAIREENRGSSPGIGIEAIKDLEDRTPPKAFAEERNGLRSNIESRHDALGRNVLHDVVGGGAQNVFRGVGLLLGNPADRMALEEISRALGDWLHQGSQRSADQGDEQPAAGLPAAAGPRAYHDRIGVRRSQFVEKAASGGGCS